ncbi:LysR family transcriptional regulator [Frigoribacterium sp. 2-23]|uniref:LysR family transcriptional regulator n=1 Tax=Frigoribacterium sp. 2-23 TaxID=3415006 RepID=UPI003C702E53
MTDDLDLQTLRVVRALADTGTITAAADLLGYSQPAVSGQLHRAEARVGQPLVLRSGRGVTLTEAGRRLAEHAVHVQAALDAAREDLARLGGLTSGRVRLAGFPSASSTIVPDILSRLRRSHPGLTVGYVEVEPPEALALLRDGAADVALTFTHDGQSAAAHDLQGLAHHTVFTDPTVLVVPRDHPFDEGDDLGTLARERWIGGCPQCRGHLLTTCASSGFAPDIVLETDNALAVLGLVAAGLGVALLPGLSLVSAAVPEGVRVIALPDRLSRRVHLVHGRDGRRVPSVQAVADATAAVSPGAHGLHAARRR